jgi:spore coat protein U-like protein
MQHGFVRFRHEGRVVARYVREYFWCPRRTRHVLNVTGLSVLLALGLPLAAGADNATAELRVSASVIARCSITVPATVDFGSYRPFVQTAGSPLDVTAQAFNIACTRDAPGVSIGLEDGLFHSGSGRSMQNGQGDGTVQYEIYTSSQRTTVWNTMSTVVYAPQNGHFTAIPLYCRISGGQLPPAGRYFDILLAVVNF